MGFVYKFVDYDNEIIYIGKTKNLERRMQQHFFNGHLPKTCYNNVCKIFFIIVDGKTNMDMMETFLINKYHPKYNEDKQFFEYLELHKNDFLSYEEPEWTRLFFQFDEKKIHLSLKEFIPQYYNVKMSMSDRCENLILQNIYNMTFKKGMYEHYFKNLSIDVSAFLQYFILLHKEILLSKNIDYRNSDVDEPINKNNSFEYVIFDVNKIKTINLEYLLFISQSHLIIQLTSDKYGLLVHNDNTLNSISNFL